MWVGTVLYLVHRLSNQSGTTYLPTHKHRMSLTEEMAQQTCLSTRGSVQNITKLGKFCLPHDRVLFVVGSLEHFLVNEDKQ